MKLIKRYEIRIYDNGEVVNVPLPLDETPPMESVPAAGNEGITEEPTRRIQQIMEVVAEVDRLVRDGLGWEDMAEGLLNQTIRKAYQTVAARNHIAVQTVADKTQRQLDLDKKSFTATILELFKTGYTQQTCTDSRFYKHLATRYNMSQTDLLYARNVLQRLFS